MKSGGVAEAGSDSGGEMSCTEYLEVWFEKSGKKFEGVLRSLSKSGTRLR